MDRLNSIIDLKRVDLKTLLEYIYMWVEQSD